jgi:hypothetical protein
MVKPFKNYAPAPRKAPLPGRSNVLIIAVKTSSCASAIARTSLPYRAKRPKVRPVLWRFCRPSHYHRNRLTDVSQRSIPPLPKGEGRGEGKALELTVEPMQSPCFYGQQTHSRRFGDVRISSRLARPWHPLLHSSKWRRGPGRGGAEKNAPCRIASIRTLLPLRASSPRSAPVPGCSNVQTTADINSSCAPATLRATHACARLRDWNLEFLWSLDVGAWSFPP